MAIAQIVAMNTIVYKIKKMVKFVDKNNILVYIIVKLTCEGVRLGSRMGVGYNLRNPKPLGSAYFFNESLKP